MYTKSMYNIYKKHVTNSTGIVFDLGFSCVLACFSVSRIFEFVLFHLLSFFLFFLKDTRSETSAKHEHLLLLFNYYFLNSYYLI